MPSRGCCAILTRALRFEQISPASRRWRGIAKSYAVDISMISRL
jgi:hypothetical protein